MATSDPEDFIDDDGDLFGDDDEAGSPKERQLSDRELDSGDDEDRNDRAGDHMEGVEEVTSRDARILGAEISRHPLPNPSNGELHALRIPKFLGIEPLSFESDVFTPPTADHHSDTQSEHFSAHDTATSTIRYRKNGKTRKLESNAVYSRWNDGSATITIGDTTYELTSKPLAPWGQKVYQDVLDSHQYLAAPYVSAQMMQLVGHFTNQYTVVPNSQLQDVAIQKLKASMQNKARESGKNEKGSGIAVIEATEDPELAKKQAEQAEKERMKLQRRRETASARAEQQTGRVRGAIGGGLSLDDLEGRSRNLSGKKKRAPGGPRQPRRRAEYDSDDDMPHVRTREDEYDMDDGFLAPSDEEQEVGSEEESEEELEEESDRETRRRKKQKTRREEPGSDVDAEGEDEEDMAAQSSAAPASTDASGARGRKRHIIEDDEDDE